MKDECNLNQLKGDDGNSFYGVIKTYVIRIGRMTAAQQRDYELLSPFWCIPYKQSLLDYETVFGNRNPVTIEIGFGMGAATAEIADQNPDKNYIGIEVHKPGVGKLLGEIQKRNLRNLRIIEYDAIEVLHSMIPDISVAAFHVFFPDPWPKKRHHKRRLMQHPHTDLFSEKLVPGGYIYMVTDWLEYAETALEQLNQTTGLVDKYSGFAEHQSWRPETKFERRGIQEERPIRELFFYKK
jgi:tRNA (guanine-N7-)-methyltransferase